MEKLKGYAQFIFHKNNAIVKINEIVADTCHAEIEIKEKKKPERTIIRFYHSVTIIDLGLHIEIHQDHLTICDTQVIGLTDDVAA